MSLRCSQKLKKLWKATWADITDICTRSPLIFLISYKLNLWPHLQINKTADAVQLVVSSTMQMGENSEEYIKTELRCLVRTRDRNMRQQQQF